MTLSAQQLQAIKHGEPIELTIEGTDCVVLRQDIYERATSSAESSPREMYPAMLKAFDQFDESSEQYLEYLDRLSLREDDGVD